MTAGPSDLNAGSADDREWFITVHKAQGSQWPAVATFLDRMGGTADDRARWLYTAITRAEKHLLLAEQ